MHAGLLCSALVIWWFYGIATFGEPDKLMNQRIRGWGNLILMGFPMFWLHLNKEFFTQQQLEILQNEITVASAEATGAFLGCGRSSKVFAPTTQPTLRKVQGPEVSPGKGPEFFRAEKFLLHTPWVPNCCFPKTFKEGDPSRKVNIWYLCGFNVSTHPQTEVPTARWPVCHGELLRWKSRYCGNGQRLRLFVWILQLQLQPNCQFHLSTWFDLFSQNQNCQIQRKPSRALFPPLRSCLCPCTGLVWGCTGRWVGVIFFDHEDKDSYITM